MILDITSLIVSSAIAIGIYILQSKLSDRETIERRLEVEKEAGEKLSYIKRVNGNSKVQLYNSKLVGKKYFSSNKRSFLWGYPYHAAELYDLAFDGVEFVCGIEEWDRKKYYKVGVIPYLRILKLLKNGDGSFNGPIFYVKPRLIQLDKYSIAYFRFRYYLTDTRRSANLPLKAKLLGSLKRFLRVISYNTFYRWRNLMRRRND